MSAVREVRLLPVAALLRMRVFGDSYRATRVLGSGYRNEAGKGR